VGKLPAVLASRRIECHAGRAPNGAQGKQHPHPQIVTCWLSAFGSRSCEGCRSGGPQRNVGIDPIADIWLFSSKFADMCISGDSQETHLW